MLRTTEEGEESELGGELLQFSVVGSSGTLSNPSSVLSSIIVETWRGAERGQRSRKLTPFADAFLIKEKAGHCQSLVLP